MTQLRTVNHFLSRYYIAVGLTAVLLLSTGCQKSQNVNALLQRLEQAEKSIAELKARVDEVERRAETAERALKEEEGAIRRIYEE
jgi:septal ring factor EnvC (AmiA/AmiB activator)